MLLIVGVILLVVGYMVPMPNPLSLLCRVGGVLCVAIAGILLVVALLHGTIAIGSAHAAASIV